MCDGYILSQASRPVHTGIEEDRLGMNSPKAVFCFVSFQVNNFA
jgi:hypothetical protein